MCYPSHADEFPVVIDYVQDSPVAYANTPNIFIAFELFAASRPRILPKRFHFAHSSPQHAIWQVFELFPRRGLYLNDIASHEAARA